LFASAIAGAVAITVAAIQRGAHAGATAFKEELEKTVTGPNGRLTKLEAKVAELGGWGAAFEALESKLVTHVNNELNAARRAVRDARDEARRATGSMPAVPSNEMLAKDIASILGIEALKARVSSVESDVSKLEAGERDRHQAAANLMREIGHLTGLVEGQAGQGSHR